MKKGLLLSLLLLGITLFSFSDVSKKRKSIFLEISKNVDKNGSSYENLERVINLTGHRLTGSENGAQAEQFAFETLKNTGYNNVEFHPFEVESWSRNSVSLAIVPESSDNFRDVGVVSLANSPKAAAVTAKIIDCKDGLESDFFEVKNELKGKVALFNINIQSENNKGRKNLHRSEKTALAIKYGASAVIIANSVKGEVLLTGNASVTGSLISIPAVCVSLESGRAIRNWMNDEKNILAEIKMLNFNKPVKARNISATHEGNSKYNDQRIILGAHLDSWDLANGAVDNGLGAFSLIDIARVFKDLKLKTKRPIDFVLFMGEEQGRLGSNNYVQELKTKNELEKIAFMLNLDMVNNTKGFNAFGNPDLRKYMELIGQEMHEVDEKFENKNASNAGLHSDHQAFMLEGILVSRPVGQLSPAAQNCYHANCDKMDLIDREEIQNNVKYTAMMLYALANLDELPPRKSSLETKDYLIAQNLKEELVLSQDWLWED